MAVHETSWLSTLRPQVASPSHQVAPLILVYDYDSNVNSHGTSRIAKQPHYAPPWKSTARLKGGCRPPVTSVLTMNAPRTCNSSLMKLSTITSQTPQHAPHRAERASIRTGNHFIAGWCSPINNSPMCAWCQIHQALNAH
jgi:hypothetical protein